MLIDTKKIAIVGGGPGGLTLARLLQMKGADVTVYERDLNERARVQGGTLDLHNDSGLEALRQAGLMDTFIANYRPGADAMRITDKYGNILMEDAASTDAQFHSGSRPEIDRGPLRDLLLASLKPGTVRWNKQLNALEKKDGAWEMTFRDGTSAQADLVIGADGANSSVRPLTTSLQPLYSGITIVEASVRDPANRTPRIHALLNGGKIFAMGDDKTIIVSSKGDGSLVFYTGSRTHERWATNNGINFGDRMQAIAWFKHAFAGWDPLWLELFEQADTPFQVRPQYCMPLDQHWTAQSDITLLGDAAHLMPPYAGEGVNMAMRDALELSECLLSAEHRDLVSAISAYEEAMFQRFAEVGAMTMEQTEALHAPHALEHILAMFSGD